METVNRFDIANMEVASRLTPLHHTGSEVRDHTPNSKDFVGHCRGTAPLATA